MSFPTGEQVPQPSKGIRKAGKKNIYSNIDGVTDKGGRVDVEDRPTKGTNILRRRQNNTEPNPDDGRFRNGTSGGGLDHDNGG